MDRSNLPKRLRNHSSPLDMNAASKFAAADLGSVARKSGQRSPSEPNLSSRTFTAGLPLQLVPPPVSDSDDGERAHPTTGPTLQTNSAEEILSNRSTSEEKANFITSRIAVLHLYESQILASSQPVDNVKSSNPSTLPRDEEIPELVAANKATENLNTSEFVGSESDTDLGSRILQPSPSKAVFDTRHEQRVSATVNSGNGRPYPLKYVAQRLQYSISDLIGSYGTELSIMMSLNRDERSLTTKLQTVYTWLQAFKANPDSATMFPTVEEGVIDTCLIVIENVHHMVPALVDDYESGRNIASNATTLAAQAIHECLKMLLSELCAIYNKLREALSHHKD